MIVVSRAIAVVQKRKEVRTREQADARKGSLSE
jgi:hypothetical protein